jgi:ADP-ribose pyrophosphatase YjhB (NUDIX family)
MTLTIIDKTTPVTADLGTVTKSIFLAGPSPRGDIADWNGTWRSEAIAILKRIGYDGHVFIPLPFAGQTYEETTTWEEHFLELADQIVFWVPRSDELPGFTTNVEFGEWMDSGKVNLGYPVGTPKMRFLDRKAEKYGVAINHTLEGTLRAAVDQLGAGAARTGGEIYVPLRIWQAQGFQSWYQAQVHAGNKLVSGRVLWSFKMPIAKKLFCWVYHANVYIAAEDRIKSNEFMFTRSDISCVVAYVRGANLLDTRVLTVKEFRTPARTYDGFVHELPGGSSLKDDEDVKTVAAHELEEECGLKIEPERFQVIGARQLAATLSTHKATVFAVEITEAEALSVLGTEHGVEADTEHTYVGLASFMDILSGAVPFDFSMIGMVAAAGVHGDVEAQERRRVVDVLKVDIDPTPEQVQQIQAAFSAPNTELASAVTAAAPKVFLGGTCADTKWREKLIEKLKIDYFNPVVADWTPECQAEEIRQRETCDFVLYVIAPQMEGVYSIAEVVDDANNRPEKTVFCVIDSDTSSDASWTKAQRKSLKAVEDLVTRRGGTVCADLDAAAAYLNKGAEP